MEKQVEAGKLTLKDLNALAQRGGEISSGVVSLIFGTGNSQEVAMAFLGSDRFDKGIEKKSAQGELCWPWTSTARSSKTGRICEHNYNLVELGPRGTGNCGRSW